MHALREKWICQKSHRKLGLNRVQQNGYIFILLACAAGDSKMYRVVVVLSKQPPLIFSTFTLWSLSLDRSSSGQCTNMSTGYSNSKLSFVQWTTYAPVTSSNRYCSICHNSWIFTNLSDSNWNQKKSFVKGTDYTVRLQCATISEVFNPIQYTTKCNHTWKVFVQV